MKTIDVIIPTYKPTGKLVRIIEMLEKQTYSVNKIIIINTEKEYFDDFFKDKDILDSYDNILVKHIKREEFDHGATRKMAVTMSDSDYFVCMTDDAVVLDEVLIENLLKPLLEGKAAVSYARQCTKKSASLIERIASSTLSFIVFLGIGATGGASFSVSFLGVWTTVTFGLSSTFSVSGVS